MHEAERNIRREERLMPKDPPADEPPAERKLFKPEAAFKADSGSTNVDLRDKEATSAEQEGISRIQRILSDPEMIEEEVDYRPTHDDGDYDSAVRNFYQDAGQSIMCKSHANRPAVDQCPVCQAYFCQECMVVRRGRLLCRDCADTVFIRSEEDILTAQELGEGERPNEVAPEEKPEFQIGSTAFGVDGRPAHPVKKLVAFLIDLAISRGVVLLLALIMGFILSHNQGAFFHLFDSSGDKAVLNRVIDATLLYQPVMPWLVIFIVADFLYFFSTLSFFNRTVGMSWMSCRIVTEWGEFASFSTVALRVLVFMVLAGWPGILLSWAFPGYRGLHDYAAGTIVINYSGLKRVDAYDTVHIKLD